MSVRGFDRRLLLAERCLSARSLRHGRCKRQRRERQNSGGTLQDEKRLVFSLHRERSEFVQRAPDCDRRENENARRCFSLGKAECSPNQ